MLTEEFERWWQEAHYRLKTGVKAKELCKEAYVYGVNLGFGAVMDSKLHDEILEDLKNDNT